VSCRCAVLVLVLAWQVSHAGEVGDNGRYVYQAAGCEACHTAKGGEPLAGGRAFATPFGTFYSPNITPHTKHGIGRWTKQQFINAVRHGRSPSGSAYFPVFPYPSYRRMTDADAADLFDYLMARQPDATPNRAHELSWWVGRWMMRPWQWCLLDASSSAPADESRAAARGRYLVDALGHCGECHSPRSRLGVLDADRHLAGNNNGPGGESVPNITPHRDDGIGKWSADDLAYFFETGELPDGDYTGGHMADVIDHGTSWLTPRDRQAIVTYLRSLPPVPGP